MITPGLTQRPIPAPYALPVSFAMYLAVGTVAAVLHGRLGATGVLFACAVIAGIMSFAAEPIAAFLLAGIGWLTTVGFSRPPYAQLRPAGAAAAHAAIAIGATALAGACLGLVFRWYARRLTLGSVGTYAGMRAAKRAANGAQGDVTAPGGGTAGSAGAIDIRRRLAGVVLAAVLLPLITVSLAAWRQHLNLADDLLTTHSATCTRLDAVELCWRFWRTINPPTEPTKR